MENEYPTVPFEQTTGANASQGLCPNFNIVPYTILTCHVVKTSNYQRLIINVQ